MISSSFFSVKVNVLPTKPIAKKLFRDFSSETRDESVSCSCASIAIKVTEQAIERGCDSVEERCNRHAQL